LRRYGRERVVPAFDGADRRTGDDRRRCRRHTTPVPVPSPPCRTLPGSPPAFTQTGTRHPTPGRFFDRLSSRLPPMSRPRRSGFRVARMSAAAGLLAVAVTGCSRADVEDKLRFGWPHGITDQAEKMRLMWTWSSVAALAVGVLVWGLTFWVCTFHRKRGEEL